MPPGRPPGTNMHNPPLNIEDLEALRTLRYGLNMTWREFYSWSLPHLRAAFEAERANGRRVYVPVGEVPDAESAAAP